MGEAGQLLDPEVFLLAEGTQFLAQRRGVALEGLAARFQTFHGLRVGAEFLHRRFGAGAQLRDFGGGLAALLL